jgi:hypothetical protein
MQMSTPLKNSQELYKKELNFPIFLFSRER